MVPPTELTPYARQLFSLTSAPAWDDVIARCQAFGWSIDSSRPWLLPDTAVFLLGGGVALFADARRVSRCPIVAAAVYKLDGDDVGDESGHSHPRRRSAYDDAYRQAAGAVTAALGPPTVTGESTDEVRPDWPLFYQLWAGPAGVMVVQQGELDPTFGPDVDVWVRPWHRADPLPTPPFDLWPADDA